MNSISAYTFKDYPDLMAVSIPDSLTSIGECAFENTPWLAAKEEESPLVIENGFLITGESCKGDVVIPDGVKCIVPQAFYCCQEITSVTIPDSVTNIGTWAFSTCEKLESVTIPETVTSLGGDVFLDTPWLMNQQKEDPLVVVNDILIDGKVCEGYVMIPDTVISIAEGAFGDGDGLTSVNIPGSVTTIGAAAFMHCDNLTSVTISDGVERIEGHAFGICKKLTTVTIPDSVTYFEGSVFEECVSLTDITLPDSVTNLGYSLFLGCTSLTDVSIPKSQASVVPFMYERCSGLTEIAIPDYVVEIRYCAFSECDNLNSITILNPRCYIFDSSFTICHDKGADNNYTGVYTGEICGYDDSTAQAYAEKYGYTFRSLGPAPEQQVICGKCGSDMKWTLDKDTGTLTVSGTGGDGLLVRSRLV